MDNQTEQVAISDKEDDEKLVSVVESIDQPWVFWIVILSPTWASI